MTLLKQKSMLRQPVHTYDFIHDRSILSISTCQPKLRRYIFYRKYKTSCFCSDLKEGCKFFWWIQISRYRNFCVKYSSLSYISNNLHRSTIITDMMLVLPSHWTQTVLKEIMNGQHLFYGKLIISVFLSEFKIHLIGVTLSSVVLSKNNIFNYWLCMIVL